MKLRLFLVFVIIYIMAVFGWWLYSFISYTEKEYKLEYNNLKLNALVIQNKMSEYLDENKLSSSETPYHTFLRNKEEIETLHDNLNRSYRIKTDLRYNDSNSRLHNFIRINIKQEEFNAIYKNFIKKQRAFYSEVIFFTILVISGVIWVFGKLESLLNLNKMQNNFLLSVTHEFKTPLTAIKLSTQTIQQRKTDEAVKSNLIQQIVNNSDRLNELLDNVLLATRIDGKSYSYDFKEIDLTELINKVAEMILCEPGFSGSFIFEEDTHLMKGDEISLKLVFSNIFQNAVKYAGQDCEVKVSYQTNDDRFEVLISDSGKGMDPKEHKAIFNKFYRVGDENTRETKGTGLGLFLVKQILRSHKAGIRAESNTPRGTTFRITFNK